MKHLICSSIFIVCSVIASAQTNNTRVIADMKPWHTTYFNMSFAVDNDHYSTMSLDRMMAFSKNPQDIQRDLSHMQAEIKPSTAGVALYMNVGMTPLNRNTGEYHIDREVRLGIGLHAPKEAMVAYKSEALDTSIVYCNLQSELTLEGAYVRKAAFGKHGRCYAGIGASGGVSYGNQMVLISGRYFEPGMHPSEQVDKNPVMEKYAAKTVTYARLFIPFGVHYGVDDQWSIGLDFRLGLGAQFLPGAPVNFIRRTGMFALGFTKRI
jgi:hypothetical protein